MKKRLWAIAIGLLAPLIVSAADLALPQQALGRSLQELAKQSGIQIIFFSRVVEGHDAPALNGTFTAEAALDKLLAGTNLTHHALNDRTIEVMARPAVAAVPPPMPLPEPQPKSEAEAAPDAPLAEVEITAERADLTKMRAEMVRLENEFYARYNQANTNHQYDVIFCRSFTVTGSHVDRRRCEPASSNPVTTVDFLGWSQGFLGWSQLPASISIETPTDPGELRAYQQNMVEVVRKHPELLELVKQRNELAERYREALKQKLEARRVVAGTEAETRGTARVRPALKHKLGARPAFAAH